MVGKKGWNLVSGSTYCYSNGVYYEQSGSQYKVVPAPVGATVEHPVGATVKSLPKGAEKKTVVGTEYYSYAGTWYQVFHSGSSVVYMVVKNPNP